MKINGLTVTKPEPKVLVIPLGDQKYVLHAQYVENTKEFDEFYPEPLAPEEIKADGTRFRDFNDKTYREKIDKRIRAKYDWFYIKSLEATEGLEWDTVDMTNPETFNNWRKDLLDAGMPVTFMARIIDMVNEVNGFDVSKLDEATESFLATIRGNRD
jgi:hypothetical protein